MQCFFLTFSFHFSDFDFFSVVPKAIALMVLVCFVSKNWQRRQRLLFFSIFNTACFSFSCRRLGIESTNHNNVNIMIHLLKMKDDPRTEAWAPFSLLHGFYYSKRCEDDCCFLYKTIEAKVEKRLIMNHRNQITMTSNWNQIIACNCCTIDQIKVMSRVGPII